MVELQNNGSLPRRNGSVDNILDGKSLVVVGQAIWFYTSFTWSDQCGITGTLSYMTPTIYGNKIKENFGTQLSSNIFTLMTPITG